MRSRSLCTLTNCRKALLAVWLISMILALPVVYTNEVYSTRYIENTTDCTETPRTILVWKCTEDIAMDDPPIIGSLIATYQMILIFLFPAILMTSAYYKVIKTLWRSTKNMTLLTNTSSKHNTSDNQGRSASVVTHTAGVDPNISRLGAHTAATDTSTSRAGAFTAVHSGTSRAGSYTASHSNSSRAGSYTTTLDSNLSRAGTFSTAVDSSNPRAVGHTLSVDSNTTRVVDAKLPGYEPTRSNISTITIQNKVLCSSGNTEKINQSRKQIIKMLLVIILLFILCWCPRFLIKLIKWYTSVLDPDTEFLVGNTFYYIATSVKILPVIHAMLNPIIYSLMCRSVRRTIFSCCGVTTNKDRAACSAVRRSQAWHDHSYELQEDRGGRGRQKSASYRAASTFIAASTCLRTSDQDLATPNNVPCTPNTPCSLEASCILDNNTPNAPCILDTWK